MPLQVVLLFCGMASVSVTLPLPLLVTKPPPERFATVWLPPSRSKVAPLLTVRAEAAGNALATPALSVPALTVVGPV